MKVDKLEKEYLETVYSIEYSTDANDLLKRVGRAIFLFLKLLYARKAKIDRTLGRELLRFLYVEESTEEKLQRLSKIVTLMRFEAINTKYPYIDFYMQNLVTELDRIMMKKRYNFFLASHRDS